MKRIFLTLFLCLLLAGGVYGSGFLGGGGSSFDPANPGNIGTGTPGTGTFTTLTGSNLNIGTPVLSSGTGSPEGAITAPIGSTYYRTDGSTGTTLYIKEAGAGNTGWVAVVSGEVTGATINDSAGNGDTTVVWSADKVFDQLALKQAADADLTTYAGITPSADIQTFLGYANFAAIKAGLSIDDLIALSGVADGAVNLGEFTGTTIPDNQTVKAGLQALETSVESKGTGDVTGPASPTAGYLTKWGPTGKALVDGPKLGTLTDTKWCTYTAADGLKCTEDSPAGSGDVTGVGDCSGGACLDGTSDGGTYIQLYDGTSSYSKMLAGVRLFTLSSGVADSEDITFTLGNNDNTVNLTSSTGADNIIGLASYSLGAAGVKLTGDGDGALTILGLGNGYDESLTINFDDVENTVGITSGSGVTAIDASTLELKALKFTSGAADGERYINVDNSAAYKTTGPAEGDISCKADTDTCARYNGSTWAVLAFKSDVISQPITGFSSGAGAVADTDTILQAINKLDGNVGTKLTGGGGVVLSDASPDADGEFGYATNAYAWFANSEDFKITASANMWTFDSNTSAAFTFTPAVTVTGTVTANGAANIGDGGDDIHIKLNKNTTNATYNGILVNLTCHETIAAGAPVFVNSDGEAALANAAAAATMPAIGVTAVGGNAADTCTILTHGVMSATAYPTFTPGNTVYVDDSAAGVLTATVGDVAGTDHVVQIIGVALGADTILVNPSLSTITLE